MLEEFGSTEKGFEEIDGSNHLNGKLKQIQFVDYRRLKVKTKFENLEVDEEITIV